MLERRATIAAAVGLHARPAAIFVQAVQSSGTAVTIAKADGEPVDAASILNVLTLGAACGDEVVLRADGDDAERVLDELVTLLATPDPE